MSKFYSVPLVAQTSNNTCWHASALMIWYYWQGQTKRQGPMNTMVNNYLNDKPITPSEFVTLAGKVGMKKVFQKYNYYSATILEGLLNTYGPLWCAGYWYGPGHIIFLTGIKNESIFLNDPDRGLQKTNNVLWFNSMLASSVDGCLMYKDSNAY